ncbi:hypothetical protein QYE76_022915 [Lolium multiflorum]|uniref:Integrase catalytic domain-containing protein n=1 Tax=Lolium multiflorum TaxID=4521 RepID=A0AAD8RDN7_LOLMU|nr:hypothetical protein QYE76_022915 [Lolium multiflorum]
MESKPMERELEMMKMELQRAGRPSVTSSPRPTSPPSGPMTRARAKAIHDKVNSLLTSLDLDTPLDGMLPHAETLCVIRYVEHQDHGEDVTPWSREGEEQLSKKMYTELDPKSPEERKEEKTDGRSRTRSDRAPDRATRLRIRSTGRLTGPPGSQPGYQPVPSGQHPGASGPRPVGARSQARSGPDRPVTGPSGPDAGQPAAQPAEPVQTPVNRPHNRPSRSRIYPPLRGIEHRIDLIPGAPLPNRAAYRTNPEDTKEIQRQIQDLLAKGEVVRLHGIPASIVSDRDVKFMSYLWKSLMAKFGVKLLFSSSSHPQTDGQTEVVNRSLSTLLRTLVKTNLKSWEDCLPHAEFAYNRAKHSTTARSPFMVVYGFEPPTALDILPLPLHERTNMDFDERTTAIKKLHEETRATIQEHVLRQATRLNAKKKERVFEEGDLVWIHLRKERFPQERNSKLKPRGDGPFKVLKRINNNAYVIDIPTSKYLVSNTFNVSDLSPYHGDEEEQESRTTLSQGGGDDAGWPSVTSSPRPTSPPSGPMTRARAKAIHDKVNSLLTSLDLDTPLDGMLPHAETLCVIRYVEHQDHGEDVTPWSREGEEQLSKKMYTELDPKSPEERKEEKTDGRSRTRSDRAPDRATRLRIRSTGRLTGPPGSQPGYQPVPSGQHPGASGPRPVGARSQARSGPDRPVTGPV